MGSLRENKLFDIRLFGSARSGAGSLFSTHKKTALLSSRFGTPSSLDALSQGEHSDDSEEMNNGVDSSHYRNTALQISPRPRDEISWR
jgi:hypothetical protein